MARSSTSGVWLLTRLALGAVSMPAFGQAAEPPAPAEAAPPASEPASPAEPLPDAAPPNTDEDRDARDLERRPREAPVVRSATAGAALPGSGRPGLAPQLATLVREGAFLRERRGRLMESPEGKWVYVFDADASGNSEPPMVVMPGRRLEAMRDVLDARPGATTFITTGQVFVFSGQNYLLPTFFSVLADEVPEPAPAAAAQGDGANPTAENLLGGMGAGAGRTAKRPPRKVKKDNAPDQVISSLLREGLTIASRRGRLSRTPTGEILFTTDNGSSSRGGEPAFVLLPCLNLEALEALVRTQGDRAAVSLSGTVYAYEQRNYLLPTLYKIEPDIDGNLVAAP
jgi:hypothetical protein